MTVAMMLPGTIPLLNVFRLMTGRHPGRAGLLLRLGAGYLAVWSLFGAAAYLGDLALHEAAHALPLLGSAIAPGVFLAAGLYQFSGLKERCLVECRSPYAFVASRWQGRSPRREAWRLGLQHGVFCLGCCWVLMLVMFAVGVAHLGWMLALGAVMAAERATRWGRLLTKPAGAALVAGAAVLLLR
jgi:predicted metal-binding membrane protein